jgi:UDP-glucose 4-epimerase
MRILVTGGAGFIGSHLADTLIEQGHQVAIVDDLSTGSRNNLPPKAEFHHLPIQSPDVEQIFRQGRFDVVYHLAAQIDVRISVREPVADVQVNVAGSVALLEHCRRHSVSRFIFASTGGAIYGEQEVFPATEDHPTWPISPYGIAKLTVEKYMYFYSKEYGINAIALRYANVYGPRQNPFGEAGVVAIFSRKMLDRQEAFINGDGLQTRDYVFVGDIIRANLAALKLEGYHTINIGTGTETDVLTIFDTLNQLTGANQPRRHRPASGGEQRRSSIDPSLAADLLGWKPQVDLEDGLSRTVDYFRTSKR